MNENKQLTEAVKGMYGIQNILLSQIDHHLLKECGVYEVNHTNGQMWMLRVSRQEEDVDSFLTCAAVLQFLKQQQYEAPYVIEGIDGAAVGMHKGWGMLMTTFIEGSHLEYTPEHVHALGTTLGRLHMVRPILAATASPPMPHSWWRPLHVGKEALHHLTLVADRVPSDLQAQYDMCRITLLHACQWEHLPTVIVHGDCHPRNAIQTLSDQVVLIDWEQAGIGPAVLDIGSLLLRCHPLWLRPNTPLIQAAIDGYCQHRLLNSLELDALFDAICFKVAVGGAWDIIDIVEGERGEEMRELKRLKKSYTLAEEITLLARARFERFL